MPDINDQVKMFHFVQKMDNYGRTNVTPGNGGPDIEKQAFVASEKVSAIIDFKELDQGCETWVQGYDYPVRGCFQNDRCITLHSVKRLIPTILRTFKKNKLVSIWYFKNNWKEYLDFIHYALSDVYYPDLHFYSEPIKEIYLAMSEHGIDKIRDIVCAILEFDTGYRYSAQSILSEIDQQSLKSNPYAEIKRLLRIYSSKWRLSGDDLIKTKFSNAVPLMMTYLWFNRKLLNKISKVLLDIDPDRVKLSEGDLYWTRQINFHYEFTKEPINNF